MRARSTSASVVIITLLLMTGCNKEPGPTTAASAPVVDVARVAMQPVKAWDSFNGRIGAMETVAILPRVSGHITQVAYREGSEVKAGDLLFVIDPRPYRAALANARAQLERARTSLLFAEQQDRRAQQLLKLNAVSKEEAEQRHTSHGQSLAEVHAAEAAVASAALNLEFTEVRSPIDGRTSRAQLTRGNLAVADQSVLTSVVSQDPLYVYFDPDEHHVPGFRKALKESRETQVRIGLASDEGFPYEGDLSFIDNQVDASTGTIRARATVRNPERRLTPGLYARVQLAIGGSVPVIVVPERAILTDQDQQYVYRLSPENTAERRYIKTGRQVGNQRVVTAGLTREDKIVVAGLQQIYASGTAVTPHELPPEDSALQVSRAILIGK
ncbi:MULTISPECIES: efflux RND transporter periplasmic adaptor subunit [Pseudomonas]|nr:efflux RND transporter periplasmic adaptor subunit [Pseudomonas sp. CMR5c]AZC16195.1 RND efflux system, membrane fusion protein [Pseudomonas sp. CMR5c]